MFKIDLHTHTLSSGHAYSTLIENITYGKEKGLELIGMSDHSPGLPGSAYIFHFQNMKHIPDEILGVRVLKGVEANIIDLNGRIDMTQANLSMLDYTIASLHPPCMQPGSRVENTKMMIKVMGNPYVNIIGHPDDSRFPLDYSELVKAAKYHDVFLEVNNSSINPNGFRANARKNIIAMLEQCAKEEVSIICGSDAHIAFDVGRFDYCEDVLNEVGFPENLVINHSTEAFMKRINAKY
jgi:putative hydrolase